MPPLPGAGSEDHRGFLIPPWYISKVPGKDLLNVASIIWGVTLSCAGFTGFKALNQSRHSWMKHRLFNSYIILVWATWVTSLVLSIVSWLYLYEIIPPSFWTFFGILIPWFIQLQCVLQIVANRVGFLLHKRKHAKRIKLGVFIVITFITVTVSCTWMPARLQISPLVIRINNVWDRLTKAIFGAMDICLNILFLRLVWRHLISNGLTKYWPLFYFNSCAIFVSISLDAIFIGLMSLKSPVVYTQFNPVVFLFKLHIELNLAEMIAEIVQSANQLNRIPFGASGARLGSRSGSRSSSGSSRLDMTLATMITADREPERPWSSSGPSEPLPPLSSTSSHPRRDSRTPKSLPRLRHFCRELMWGYKQTSHRGPRPSTPDPETGTADTGNDHANEDDGIFPRGPLAEDLRRCDSNSKGGNSSGIGPAAVTELELNGISRSASYSYDWGASSPLPPHAPQPPRRAVTTGRIRIESVGVGGSSHIGSGNAAAAAVHSHQRRFDSVLMGGVASCCSGQSSTAVATMTMMGEEVETMQEYFPPGLVAGTDEGSGSETSSQRVLREEERRMGKRKEGKMGSEDV